MPARCPTRSSRYNRQTPGAGLVDVQMNEATAPGSATITASVYNATPAGAWGPWNRVFSGAVTGTLPAGISMDNTQSRAGPGLHGGVVLRRLRAALRARSGLLAAARPWRSASTTSSIRWWRFRSLTARSRRLPNGITIIPHGKVPCRSSVVLMGLGLGAVAVGRRRWRAHRRGLIVVPASSARGRDALAAPRPTAGTPAGCSSPADGHPASVFSQRAKYGFRSAETQTLEAHVRANDASHHRYPISTINTLLWCSAPGLRDPESAIRDPR